MRRQARDAGMRRRRRQAGQETLQSIFVVAFVLLPVVASIFVAASLVHVYIGEQAAAAAGARAAGAAGGFGDAQRSRVDAELAVNGISPSNCKVTASAGQVGLDEPIAITVGCPQRVGIPFLLTTNVAIESTFVGHGEINQ